MSLAGRQFASLSNAAIRMPEFVLTTQPRTAQFANRGFNVV
jgi:hypothetical protein